LWFGLGVLVFAIFSAVSSTSDRDMRGVVTLSGIAMLGWVWLTIFAVPIGIVRWLVRGRDRAS
jgi:NADH:ubiquinone oxidoreductase subunit 4 (subunit M)